MVVVRVVSDLFFSSKITEVCKTLHIESVVARSKEKLEQIIQEQKDLLVLVDLGAAQGAGPEIAALAVKELGAERVYAFYSHVAEDLLEQATAYGVVNITTRSNFFNQLPNLLNSINVKAA